jgi:DNA-binding NarL/FixJ family response regulator
MLLDLKMEVAGEASDWFSTLAKAPAANFDILLVDWDMLPMNAATGLAELRKACSSSIVVVLTSRTDTLKQAALSAGADAFISKGEIPNDLAEKLQLVAKTLDINESAAHSLR